MATPCRKGNAAYIVAMVKKALPFELRGIIKQFLNLYIYSYRVALLQRHNFHF